MLNAIKIYATEIHAADIHFETALSNLVVMIPERFRVFDKIMTAVDIDVALTLFFTFMTIFASMFRLTIRTFYRLLYSYF